MLKNKLLQSLALPPRESRFLLATLLILGIFFRFVNLDRKIYWFDETYTSMRASGFTETELIQELSNTPVIGRENLQKYQRPSSEKSLLDTIKSLVTEDPQHPPLYYLMARFWMQKFGSSVAVMRSLPALISLLAFPCIYWLCLELFDSSLTGWVAIALIAVSPLHVLYAQESREYSLWTVTILISCIALLRAMRIKTQASWSIYALTLAASLYTFLLSFLVAVGHGIYVFASHKFRLNQNSFSYLMATALGIVSFLPWIAVIIFNRVQVSSVTGWMGFLNIPFWELLKIWGINLTRIFVDFNYSLQDPVISQVALAFIIIFISTLVGYSFYFLYHNASQRMALFILTLIGSIVLPIALPDLVLGGVRSTTPRYFMPCYLGIQLSVAYLFATKLTEITKKTSQQKLWQLVMALIVSIGVLSCVISSQAATWWHQTLNRDTPTVAALINKAETPALISDSYSADILSLSYLLSSNVRLILKPRCYTSCNALYSINEKYKVVDKPYLPETPDGFTDIFLFKTAPSDEWKNELKANKNYTIKSTEKPGSEEFISWLWKLEKRY